MHVVDTHQSRNRVKRENKSLRLTRRDTYMQNFPLQESSQKIEEFKQPIKILDQYQYLGNRPPTPPLTQH